MTPTWPAIPGINGYLESVKENTRLTMYAETLLGRRRYLPDIQSSNHNVRAAAERMAINMPVQGTAADIMKKAMINVRARMIRDQMRSRDDFTGARRVGLRSAGR